MVAMIRDKVAEGVAESPAGGLKRSRRIAGVSVGRRSSARIPVLIQCL
jgi:hypothetical protein